eukprot:5395451-Pyramimonas_sp.AAC.3
MGGQISHGHAVVKVVDEKRKTAVPSSQHSSPTQKEGDDSCDCVARSHGFWQWAYFQEPRWPTG